jgi:hypothetical protein
MWGPWVDPKPLGELINEVGTLSVSGSFAFDAFFDLLEFDASEEPATTRYSYGLCASVTEAHGSWNGDIHLSSRFEFVRHRWIG